MKCLLSAVNTTSLMEVVVNNVFANAEDLKDVGSKCLGGEEPRSRKWQPAPVFSRKFQGQRSLAGPQSMELQTSWTRLGTAQKQ